ncbi:hypothetical protein [Fluviicola sp.]|uniref:hypothetical protein n=1 Tax=Fluviicola sp. TaxID=1917219 RepID=UPI003D27E696
MKALVIFAFLWSFQTFAQEKEVRLLKGEKNYRLDSKTEHSDLNYKLFKLFGSVKIYSGGKIEKAFLPKKGTFTVYVFTSEYVGDSFDGTRKLFHDKLILKVNPKTNEVMDGFQYTMEWAEPPALSDLFRVTDDSIVLTDKMNLDELQMQVDEEYFTEDYSELDDHGILNLK